MSDDKNSPDYFSLVAVAYGFPLDKDDDCESSIEMEYDNKEPNKLMITVTDVDGSCATGTFSISTLHETLGRFPIPHLF